MNFADRLDQAIRERETPALVGLDPHLDLLPDEFAAAADPKRPRAERAELLERFCTELIDLVAGRVPAVKPQSAFFELLGADGVRAWERVVVSARAHGLLVIGDVKRSDIGSTARAYATALLEGEARCDAITINPYLGSESVEPFIEVCHKVDGGLFVLVRTSNPGSEEFQHGGTPPLCERVARAVAGWGAPLTGKSGLSSVGVVMGTKQPGELRRMREILPNTHFLLPGYGAQGTTAKELGDAFLPGGRGAIVNASRSIAFAYRAPARAHMNWKDASRAALDEMIADFRPLVEAARGN